MDLLLSVSLRGLIPAIAACVVLGVGRVKAAAARHAIWTVVMIGMLLCLALAPALPPIALRLLPPIVPVAAPTTVIVEMAPAAPAPLPTRSWFSCELVYGAGVLISLLRLAFGYGFTRRLVRESRHVENEIYESNWISVPMTVGWLRPKILLPPNWREWDDAKLEAVLAHERTHVRRGDWAIAGVAAINRSLFWFHPLAWWLERTLATLAEQACDDAAVLETGTRAQYAQVLLEMAAAVRARRGRMVWEAMAMAKAAEVHVRIDRILDETRQIPDGLSRGWRAGLLACSLPLVYAAVVLHVAPALAQEQVQEQKQTAPPPASQPATAAPASASTPARKAPAPRAAKGTKTAPPPASQAAAAAPAPVSDPAPEDTVRQWRAQHVAAAAEPQAADQAPTPRPAEKVADLTPITRVEPVYPKIAQQTGAKGRVQMLVTVAPDGYVKAVKVLSGHPMLQSSAMEAVKQWVFNPQPVEQQTVASVTFQGDERPVIQQAVLISRKEPVYPEMARVAGVTGVVTLRATIGKDGRVSEVHTVKGDPLLARAAEDAVREWIYRPTMFNGAAVETETQIMLNFAGNGTSSPQARSAGGVFEGPELISRKEPVHPGGDLQSLEGTVTFRARVGVDGKLSNIRAIDGPAELVLAALEAVKQWVYRPARLNGRTVESDTQVTLRFTSGR